MKLSSGLKPKKRKIGFEVRESRARYGVHGRKRPR